MESLTFDLAKTPLREINRLLHGPAAGLDGRHLRIENPDGAHNIAVGLNASGQVVIDGHAGYYAGGMNQCADITIEGSASTGVAENMMSGRVHVKGFASNAAGASAHGGLLVLRRRAIQHKPCMRFGSKAVPPSQHILPRAIPTSPPA